MKLWLLLLSFSALAEVQTWNNPECTSGNCAIRSMKVSVTYDGPSSYMVAELKTTSPAQVRDYAFVQYIRGCVFDTTAAGQVKFRTRSFRGSEGVPFQHPTWQIDSMLADPIYFSTRNPGWDELRGMEIPRNANYMVVDPSGGREVRWGGRESNVVDNRLFVFDNPTGGIVSQFNGQTVATNSSLEFRICLHKISDIPQREPNAGAVIANPIACLNWDARFHYDFARRRHTRSATLHPACVSN